MTPSSSSTDLSRLSEDPEITVGVLEAGEWHRDVDEITIPGVSHYSFHESPSETKQISGLLGTTLHDPRYDWGFTTVPQKHANGRIIPQPRCVSTGLCSNHSLTTWISGKGLGGSSLVSEEYLPRFGFSSLLVQS